MPNEGIKLSQTGTTSKAKVDARDYISRIAEIWALQGESLKRILQRLQSYYGQNIRCDVAAENKQISGKLYLSDDSNRVTKSTLSILPAEYIMKDDVIYME